MARRASSNRRATAQSHPDAGSRARGRQLAGAAAGPAVVWPLCLAAALAGATLILYWPATGNEFIDFDDPLYVTENLHVRPGLTWQNVAWAWTSLEEANWHPLAWMSHQLDASLYGAGPTAAWGHHLTSIIIHAINSGLALVILFACTGRLWPSALVAALFAWHPLHVESVVWVSERKDVLSALFFWLTLAAYLYYTRQPGSWGRWLLVIACLALGLSAKPMLVTTPFVLLLLDYWPLRRTTLNTNQLGDPRATKGPWLLVREKLPLFALVIASCVVTYIAQHNWGAVGSIEDVPIANRLANAATAYLSYLGKIAWPVRLAVFYPYGRQEFDVPGLVGPVAAVLILVAVSAVALAPVARGRDRFGWLTAGWFWYLGMLVPVIGLVQVGSQSMADRYTYLPAVGIFIIFAWSVAALARHRPTLLPGWMGLVLVLLAGVLYATHLQIGYWKDRVTLYQHALEVTERNQLAHSNLGAALYELGMAQQSRPQVLEAADHFRRAIEINPRLAQAHNGLGMVHAALGEFDEAAEEYAAAHRAQPAEPKVANNLAWALATHPDPQKRQPDRAISLAQEACRVKSYQDPLLVDTLAAAYASAGRFDEASATAQQAIDLARRQGAEPLAQSIAQRRALYQQGRPYADVPGLPQSGSRAP